MNTPNFWTFFDEEVAHLLGLRKDSFRYIFEYLDKKNCPVFVVETGCVHQIGTWKGEGQSTILFDRFVTQRPGSIMHTVDIDPNATALCKTLVSSATNIHTGDSISFLRELSKNPPPAFRYIDVLYLDSYDLDFNNPHPSALHHMKELLAISGLIGPDTLVVVDDAPSEAAFVQTSDQIQFLYQPKISGKGKYVADYAKAIGLNPVFSGYQAGWIGF